MMVGLGLAAAGENLRTPRLGLIPITPPHSAASPAASPFVGDERTFLRPFLLPRWLRNLILCADGAFDLV